MTFWKNKFTFWNKYNCNRSCSKKKQDKRIWFKTTIMPWINLLMKQKQLKTNWEDITPWSLKICIFLKLFQNMSPNCTKLTLIPLANWLEWMEMLLKTSNREKTDLSDSWVTLTSTKKVISTCLKMLLKNWLMKWYTKWL